MMLDFVHDFKKKLNDQLEGPVQKALLTPGVHSLHFYQLLTCLKFNPATYGSDVLRPRYTDNVFTDICFKEEKIEKLISSLEDGLAPEEPVFDEEQYRGVLGEIFDTVSMMPSLRSDYLEEGNVDIFFAENSVNSFFVEQHLPKIVLVAENPVFHTEYGLNIFTYGDYSRIYLSSYDLVDTLTIDAFVISTVNVESESRIDLSFDTKLNIYKRKIF